MSRVVIVLSVTVLLAMAVATCAQGQGGGADQSPPAPALLAYQDFVFVELNSVVYKIDPAQAKVVAALFLLAPGAPVPGAGAAGAPPPG